MRRMFRLVLSGLLVAGLVVPVLAAPQTVSHDVDIHSPATPAPLGSILRLLGYSLGLAALGITIRKDTASMAKKFVRNAGAAVGDYKDGVAGAGGEWETNTKAAEPAYEQGVQEAIARKGYGKGVAGSGGRYQQNAVTLGAQRYPGGIQNAEAAWQQGVGPSLDALKSLTLPPRGPRRSPQNMQRAEAVARTLGAVKTGR